MTEQQEGLFTEAELPTIEYGIVEVFGHIRVAGQVAEVERFGAKFIRVDIPVGGKFTELQTVFYSGPSIFSFRRCSLEEVVAENRRALRLSGHYESRALTYHGEDDDESPI